MEAELKGSKSNNEQNVGQVGGGVPDQRSVKGLPSTRHDCAIVRVSQESRL